MFNNPYNMYPYINQAAIRNGIGATTIPRTALRGGLFKSLAGIKWGNVLTNTQKTLNVINQAIPVYYQIKPIYSNFKNFGKIMSIFNEPSSSNTKSNQTNTENNQSEINEKKENSNLPTFFIN